jgi:4'-phosphopantetheinyl transferase
MAPFEPVPEARRLAGRDLVVRYVAVGDDDDSALTHVLRQLTAGEQAHAARFRFAKDQLGFALGRVLARKTLSRYGRPPPGGWQFTWNRYGKPELLAPPPGAPLRFNISHCAGMVTVGLTLGRDIGIDVESVTRTGAGAEIARSCFAVEEVRVLDSLPEAQRQSAFVATWTLKEAYVKAKGMGLSIPLADFSIALDPPRISFAPRLADDDRHWFLWQENPTPLHCLAVAARRQPGEELRVCRREVRLDALI